MMRCAENPLLTVRDVKPSRPGLCVRGIFNCGACRFGDQILLVCRVAESAGDSPREVAVPVMRRRGAGLRMEVVRLLRSEHPELDFSDGRTVLRRSGARGVVCLTSFSHLRLARSFDGVHFRVDERPMAFPETEEESWGMEDPRVTRIAGNYYISYTAVSARGPAVGLMRTRDFCRFERLGLIFAPENKDVAIFPARIGGLYYALNRPVCPQFGAPQIWICKSPDLVSWGRQRPLFSGAGLGWGGLKVGGGAVPFLTEKGWVEFYHAADGRSRYRLGAMLLDRDDPEKILAWTKEPLLRPETEYEKRGFFGGTVFTCGCIRDGDRVLLYYGAADDKICRADFTLDEIFRALRH